MTRTEWVGRGDAMRTVKRRRGFLLVEMMAACAMLAAVMTALAQGLGWFGTERRVLTERRTAAAELANLAEVLYAASPEGVTLEAARAALPADLPRRLRDPRLDAAIDPEEPAGQKRVRLTLSWKAVGRPEPARVHLTIWTGPRS